MALAGVFLSPASGQPVGSAFAITTQNGYDHAQPAGAFDGTNNGFVLVPPDSGHANEELATLMATDHGALVTWLQQQANPSTLNAAGSMPIYLSGP